MSFVRHEPCPRCGSRDNMGRYSDGGAFCFGCGYSERGSINPFVTERNYEQNQRTDDEGRVRPSLPDDAETTIRGAGADWLSKYRISPIESLRAGWRWSESWQQLLFPFYDKDNKLCCLQARNFNPQRASKAKYYNQGEKSESWTIYQGPRTGKLYGDGFHRGFSEGIGQDNSKVLLEREEALSRGNKAFQVRRALVLTEDAVSSLVVARCCDAMPLLGTHIAKEKIVALWATKQWDELVVFLDPDKYKESRNISDQAKLIGFKSKAIYADSDPKDFSTEELQQILTR